MKIHSLIAGLLLCLSFDSRAALIHQYELNGSLADELGGPALYGNPTRNGGYYFEQGRGLRLDAHLGEVYSIDMNVKFYNLFDFGYKRILWDGEPSRTDGGLYTNAGKKADEFVLYPDLAHSGGSLRNDTYARVTVTRDADDRFKVYQDNELVLDVLDTMGYGKFMSNAVYFFQDNGYENHTGTVDFIHIYDHALSAGEINGEQPPSPVPEPMPLTLIGAGLAAIGWTRRRWSQ